MAIGLDTNKAWYERAFVSISQVGGSEVEARSFTTSMSVSGGGFDTENLETFGGQLTRTGSRDEFEISFDAVPASVRDFDWLAHGQNPTSTSITSSSKPKTRVTLLWTDKTAATSAAEAIASGSEAYRQIYSELYCTGVEYNMDAGEELTATLNFKGGYEDETSSINFKKQMCATGSATTSLSAVPSYTTTTKF